MRRATFATTLVCIGFMLSKAMFSMLASPLSDLLGFLFVAAISLLGFTYYPPAPSPRFALWRKELWKTLLLFCPFFVAVWAIGALAGWIGGFFGVQNAVQTDSPLSILFASQVLFAALTEEWTFRFVCLRYLAPYHKGMAVIVSAALFALMHQQILQVPYAFVAGLLLGVLTLLAKSPIPAFLFHLLNNAIHLSSALWSDTILLFALSLCTAGTAACLLWSKYRKTLFQKSKEALFTANPPNALLGAVLFSPITLLFIVLLLTLLSA